MGSKKAQTIGFAYYMGLHMVIAKSADALLAIRAGGRNLFTGERYTAPSAIDNGHFPCVYNVPYWTRSWWNPVAGSPAPVTANERLYLFKPELFGGKDREGGIAGALDVMFGEEGQQPNDYLEAVLGSAQPAYLHSFGAVFRGGMVGAMNPYLKAWGWRVRRNLKGWEGGVAWYPEACQIDVGEGVLCMNPAHIIYQVFTDAEDGMGYPAATIDDENFRAAADLFKAEGLGLFFKWMQSDKIENFVQAVADHCNAMVVQNPLTSLFQIIPMRGDYDPETLLTLTPDNAVLESFERTTLEETVNEITVKWDDTHTLNEGSLTFQSLANIQAMGGVISQTKTYAGVPTAAIASRLGQRDLDIASALLARCRIKANRIAHGVVPGAVVRLQGFTKLGLQTVLVRALRVKYGGPDRQEITIEGTEDVFGLPVNSYVGTQPSGWVPPSTTPMPPPNVEAFEVPFRDLVQVQGIAEAEALSPVSGFLGMVAQKPPGIPFNFNLLTRQGSAAYEEVAVGDFTPTATLSAAVGKADTVIPITSLSNFGQAFAGDVAFIGAHPTAEAVRIDSIEASSITVARGTLDTTPKAWPIGTRLWVYDNAGAASPHEYVDGETVNAKAQTVTGTGILAESDSPTDSVTFDARAARPYPPARLRVNGATWPSSVTAASISATWNHRDRIVQGDAVLGTDEPSVGPEPGTTYTVRWESPPGTLFTEEVGIIGAASTPVAPASGQVRVYVTSHRDSLQSFSSTEHTFEWTNESALASVVAWLPFNEADGTTDFVDVTGRIWNTVGQVEADGGSALFDGVGDRLTSASDADLAFGTEDFMIQADVLVASGSINAVIFSCCDASSGTTQGFSFYARHSGQGGVIRFFNASGGTSLNGTTVIPLDEFHNIKVARQGDLVTIELDGVLEASATIPTDFTDHQFPIVGAARGSAPGDHHDGRIKNLIIKKGTSV